MFTFLDPLRAREAFDPVEILTDWERFQSLASELVSPCIHIRFSEEAVKVARGFIPFTYRLSTRKTTILDRED